MSAEMWAWATIIMSTTGAIWYCSLMVLRRVSPPPAAWIIATVAMNLSFMTYWGTPRHTLIGNITNLMAAVWIFGVTALLLGLLWRREELKISFDRFQWGSLIAAAIITVFWKQSIFLSAEHRSTTAFICVQTLMVLSSVVLISKTLRFKKNLDSIVMWLIIGTASSFGYSAAVARADLYGQANSIRSVISSLLMVVILTWFDLRRGRWELISAKYQT